MWLFAIQYNFHKLEQISFDFILCQFKKIWAQNDFLNLNEIQFNQIITSEWLNADDEEIQEATEAWYKHRHNGLQIHSIFGGKPDLWFLSYRM